MAQAEPNGGQLEEEHEQPAGQYAAVDVHRQDDEDEEDKEDFDDRQRLIP